ncbi:hypothetical protein FNV43_RR17776 [Rhamnella rubrinervis]|uniref:Uncharacterized protein n=1 Tax=Rhamnella rubrinervis TaxID=2594499 RepID=A0A8K0GVY7_9ROSA|nr:hypothetical protein FNV43_RR17776 [Rhamnella rubrinervis]
MATSTPEEIASMHAHVDAQVTYELRELPQMLKAQLTVFSAHLLEAVMVEHALSRSSPAVRRTPLLEDSSTAPNGTPREKRQFGEVAGGTTAECAAVCCCCPLTVMNLLITVVYRVPAGLCRKAFARKRKRQRMPQKKGLLQRPSEPHERTREELEAELKRVKEEVNITAGAGAGSRRVDGLPETGDFKEQEMWDRFYGTGFWRSPSQRESSL